MSDGLWIALFTATVMFFAFINWWRGRPNPGPFQKGVQEALANFRKKIKNPGPFRKDVQEALVDFGNFIGTLVGGLVGVLMGVAGCLLSLAIALVGLFCVIWLIKRLWEAA